jgi:hypothetical protein
MNHRPMTGTAERPHEHPPPAVVVLPTEIDLASAPAVTETLIFAVSTGPGVVVADLTCSVKRTRSAS